VVVEPDAPIADTKTELGWVNAAQTLDIARASRGKTVDRGDHPKSHGAIETGQVSLRFRRKNDAFYHEGSW